MRAGHRALHRWAVAVLGLAALLVLAYAFRLRSQAPQPAPVDFPVSRTAP